MRPLVWLLADPRVVVQTRYLPNGPLLIIANHVTAYDGAIVLYALPPRLRRHVAIAMSGDLLLDFRKARRPQVNSPYEAIGRISLPGNHGAVQCFSLAAVERFPPQLCPRRRCAGPRIFPVLIFPEGHRSEDGRLQPFRPGIGLLALQSRVPILPIALRGLGELKRENARWFRSGRLTIHVGNVVPFDGSAEPGELTRAFEQRVRELGS